MAHTPSALCNVTADSTASSNASLGFELEELARSMVAFETRYADLLNDIAPSHLRPRTTEAPSLGVCIL